MHMIALKIISPRERASRGISLIIVLILMIIIGITASTAMRNATSEQRATNNQRMEASAQQYAEAALRYCESEMQILPPVNRHEASLQGIIPATTGPGPTASGWEDPLSWPPNPSSPPTGGRASASWLRVPNNVIQDTTNTVLPTFRPECVVESMTGFGIVITARGFSPDYSRDLSSGITTSGAVVWLQSVTN
nr:PilX N-terminal domain-containing pilus assembly protein [Rhodoferax sp.]